MPYNCYSEIISPTKEKHKQVFQNMDMSAVFVLLKFLDRRLNCKDDLIGNLSPVVTAFIRMIKAERLIRKYTRLQVINSFYLKIFENSLKIFKFIAEIFFFLDFTSSKRCNASPRRRNYFEGKVV